MLQPDFLARFTSHLREALQKSLSYTLGCGREVILPGDVLVGMMLEEGSVASDLMKQAHVTNEQAEEAFRGMPTPHEPGATVAPDLSVPVRQLLERSVLLAHRLGHKYVGTEHLLLTMLDMGLPDVDAFLKQRAVSSDDLRHQLDHILKTAVSYPDLSDAAKETEEAEPSEPATSLPAMDQMMAPKRDKRPKALDAFARELTSTEVADKLDPVIGRDRETERLIEVLCRRTKNNPILLGEPGVGKTAVVEGLAKRLSVGQVPDLLHGRRIYALDMAMLVAGTMYRGEFEARIKQIVEEAKADANVILFIDEIHTIVGAGSTSGTLDAANILKPALARGEIRCIGATTWAEYKKHIEPDAALERRYQTIDVVEPDQKTTLQMLNGLKTRYEDHHAVRYSPATLEAAVKLAARYVTDRHFPDKAIDLLDEAAAHASSRRQSSETVERLRAMNLALGAIGEKKRDAVETGDLKLASSAQQDEERLLKEKRALEQQLKKQREGNRIDVTPNDIAKVVARMLHVSVDMLLSQERERLGEMNARLRKHLVGQDEAIASVSAAVQKAALGLSDPRRPKASFLFVGPSGVGKTELAKRLAVELFGREKALVRFDMSEFAEGHSVSKLLGSPAGYVGYREGNRLFDTIRKNPHSVLLLDEFEKAHSDVQHLLLQGLEEGSLTDSTGKPISLTQTYIILTSNVGAEALHSGSIGFSQASEQGNRYIQTVHEQVRERFRPELLNRLDQIVVFQPLDREKLKTIVQRELNEMFERLRDHQKVDYVLADNVLDWLLKREINMKEGARAARHLVEREVSALLGKSLIEQPNKKKWKIKVSKGQLVCS